MTDPSVDNSSAPESPLVTGEIVDFRQGLAVVRLADGSRISARFARRLGCLFGPVIGWQVEAVQRRNRGRPALIVRILDG